MKKKFLIGAGIIFILFGAGIYLISGENLRNVKNSVREMVFGKFETGYNAKSLIALDLENGEIFIEKKPNESLVPASLAKLFVIDFANSIVARDEIVRPNSEVLDLVPEGSSLANLSEQEYTVENLYAAMLIPSGNDAAYVLADFVGGKLNSDAKNPEERRATFLAKLADFLSQEKYKNTKISDPAGFDFSGATTTGDLRKVVEKLLKNDWFRNIVSQSEFTAKLPNGAEQTWKNTNVYLDKTNETYYKSGIKGVKTGSLGEDYNLVVLYEKNGKEFLIISLGSQSDTSRYDDVFYVLQEIDQSSSLFEK